MPKNRPAQVAPNKVRSKSLGFAIVLVMITLFATHLPWTMHATAQQDIDGQHITATTKHANDQFDAALQQITSQYPDLGLSVVVTSSQPNRHHYGTKQAYEAASTAKLITAAAYLSMVGDGKMSLQSQIESKSLIYWLREMVIKSDDDAWNVLNSNLTHERLTAYASSIGMRNFDADNNTMTADDMATFMHRLAAKTLLDSKRTALLESLMQKANYRDYIVAAVPDGYSVSHKVGFTGEYLHDTAIISKGDHWITLVIFTSNEGNYSSEDQAQVMHTITKAALNAYF